MDGTWLLLFRSDTVITLETLEAALAAIEGAQATRGEASVSVALDGHPFEVSIDASPGLSLEAERLVSTFAPMHREKEKVLRCDRRFVLKFDAAAGRAAANALIAIETALSALVEGHGSKTYAFNPQLQEFF